MDAQRATGTMWVSSRTTGEGRRRLPGCRGSPAASWHCSSSACWVTAAVTSDDDRGRLAATRDDCPSAREAGGTAFTAFDDVAGCRVDFVGTVTSVFDDNTFVVQSGSSQLVVVDGSRGSVRAAGQAIRVTGRADKWQFARIAPEIDLQKDPAAYARLEGQDVIVADVTVPAN